MGEYVYSTVEFAETLKSSFIDNRIKSNDHYAPKLVSNDPNSAANVLSVLKGELADCISFDFSVAFITSSGVQVLVEILNQLKARSIPGRVLVSTYLNFNDPAALSKLLEFPNIQVRVFQGDLHAKGYIFDKGALSTIIIGSSNLTQTALTCNKEWNVLFRSFSGGGMLRQSKEEFEKLWDHDLTVKVTAEWVHRYAEYRQAHKSNAAPPRQSPFIDGAAQSPEPAEGKITPNKMQSHALEALSVLHRRNEPRALLVSATGTGKTYLSAFDVQRFQAKRVLFVAHRQRILEASLASFERVLGNAYSYDLYRGNMAKPASTCVFAMVGSLSKHLELFDPQEFDYIIIDEAHRTGANSYLRVLDYFTPTFCLGMTATPSRTDGYDVYRLFNHVIAYRITLQDALGNNMLAPFHYFGIADLSIDDKTIDDLGLFSKLTSEERVRHITQKIEEYTVEKKRRCGLVFCNRNDEAQRLSQMFNERGYRTRAISGSNCDEERDEAIAQLEQGELEYLFSVDILNEGVDIPSLNQIIMLRRTESPIVFVQQLGRGLRKHKDKDYALVLDFIGNYQQNYLVPIALSGDRTFNKDNLRRVVKEGSACIPGCSTVSFDKVSEAYVFKALEEGRFAQARLIRAEYEQLKNVLGRIPTLVEFDQNESIDPLIIFKKYGSYAAFLERCEKDWPHSFSSKKLLQLKFISQKLATGKRYEDLAVLWKLITGSTWERPGSPSFRQTSAQRLDSVSRVLSGAFSTSGEELAIRQGNDFELGRDFKQALEDEAFRRQVLQTLEFGLNRNAELYSQSYKDTDFVLNAKYTREEVARLLHWKKEPNMQNVGGYFFDEDTNTFPVFIDYQKDPSISVTTQYEDRFVSDDQLIAISKSKRTMKSPEITRLKNTSQNGMRCFLFLRKNKKDKDGGTEFYFLGEMHPTGEFRQFVMKNTKTTAVEINYQLEQPVRADLYDYFLSDFNVPDQD